MPDQREKEEDYVMSIIGTYIVPHPPLAVAAVGRGKEKEVQATLDAYQTAADEIAGLKPETIVILTPHSIMYADYIHISSGAGTSGDFRRFGAPEAGFSVIYDAQLVSELSAAASEAGINAGTLGEKDKALDHGMMVPLYFIEKAYGGEPMPSFVRISLSGLSFAEHYRFGQCLKEVIERLGRRAVIVASGDLSHRLKDDGPYDFAEEGPLFDRQVTDAMRTADFMKFLTFSEEFAEAAGECGLRAFIIMAGALDSQAVSSRFLSYEGTFAVGYGVCCFRPVGEDPGRDFGRQLLQYKEEYLAQRRAQEGPHARLARLSLETYVRTRQTLAYTDELLRETLEGLPIERLTGEEAEAGAQPERLAGETAAHMPEGCTDQLQDAAAKARKLLFEALSQTKAGVFVSLKKDGRLRGCIGTISAAESNIASEILRNAVSAGAADPRFDPVGEAELAELVYSVDVLGEAEPIHSKDQLNVKKYGVIVTKGHRRGLLLPNLESVTSVEQQIEIALQKAGIVPDEGFSMERFEVSRFR